MARARPTIRGRPKASGDCGQNIRLVAELGNKSFQLGVPFQAELFLLRNRQPRHGFGGAGLGVFADPIKIDVLRHAERETTRKVVIDDRKEPLAGARHRSGHTKTCS